MKGVRREHVDWFYRTCNRSQWWPLVNVVTHLRNPKKVWIFFLNYKNDVSFARRIYSLTLVIIPLLCNRTYHHVYSQSSRLSLWRRKPKLAMLEPFTTGFSGYMTPTGLRTHRQRTQTSNWHFTSKKDA